MSIFNEIREKLSEVFEQKQVEALMSAFLLAYDNLVKASDFNELKEIVREIAIHQKELSEAQKRTEIRLNELAKAQKKNLNQIFAELDNKTKLVLEKFPGYDVVKIILTHFATQKAIEQAKKRGIIVVQSFEW